MATINTTTTDRSAMTYARLSRLGLAIVLSAAGLAGCASQPNKHSERSTALTTAQPQIEFIGFSGCPNTPAMRANLRTALAVLGGGWAFDDIGQEALPADDVRRGYASPTVLIDGHDLYGMPVPTAPSMGCRVYPGGVPSAADLADRLREATDASRGRGSSDSG